MCGIAGILLSSTSKITDMPERLCAMATAMYHRGPDDEGIYLSENGRVGLASRRLAIRDLSPAGHMPMRNADGTVWITYNGEIYNAPELRQELEKQGFAFRSSSNTEVILHGYEAWGEGVVQKLNGMFAFAILTLEPPQGQPKQLFLARDHLGIKPLYYAQTNEGFVFASELKAIHASDLVSREVSAAGLVGYLLMGSVPNPLTIYRDIQALEPASQLTVKIGKTIAEPQKYWNLPTDIVEPPNYEAAVEQIRELLSSAVRSQLVSDVPLGAFLSGGLDSSAVVALMRQATDGPIRTCSMVFDEAEYSEAAYAQAMAHHVGAEHFERVITAQDLADEWDNIFAAMDQPSVDGVNSYFVSQTARQAGLTVALSGLGGDELFGGYPWSEAAQSFDATQHIAERAGDSKAAQNGHAFAWTSRDELRTYTHHQLLRDTDVMSMAHSLEVRVPLLDKNLVEAALRLPAKMKLFGEGPKPLLAQSIGDLLPDSVRNRRDKQGFTFPFDRWLREGFKTRTEEVISDVQRQGVLQSEAIENTLLNYRSGQLHWSRLWAVMSLHSINHSVVIS